MTRQLMLYEEYSSVMHGNQRYIVLLMKYLARDVFEPHVVTRSSGALLEFVKPLASASSLGEPVPAGILRRLRRLRAVLSDARPDIVFCNNERSLLISWLAACFKGLRFVWYIKNARVFWPTDIIGALVARRIFVISEALPKNKGGLFRWLARKKLSLLPIGIPLEHFLRSAPIAGEGGDLHVLVVAAITPMKGLGEFIDALQEIESMNKRMHVRVIGATPHGDEQFAEDIRSRAQGLRHVHVEFHGWTDDVLEELNWSQVVVLPSRSEGVPRSLIEAMAAGRPVVATDVGGVRETVPDEAGIVVPAQSAKALSKALLELDADRARLHTMGAYGREWARTRFDIRAHVEQLQDELIRVVKEK